jgi:hypothetical protein
MCQNAEKTVYEVLAAEEPTIKSILTLEGVADTPAATNALTAYDQALADLQSWVPGSPSQDAIEVLDDAQEAITALGPLVPQPYGILLQTALAGIVLAIGMVTGNSPAPTPASLPDGVTADQVQQDHERDTMATYSVSAQALVPFYKIQTRGTWLPERHPAEQYKACWNKAVELSGAPTSFKV